MNNITLNSHYIVKQIILTKEHKAKENRKKERYRSSIDKLRRKMEHKAKKNLKKERYRSSIDKLHRKKEHKKAKENQKKERYRSSISKLRRKMEAYGDFSLSEKWKQSNNQMHLNSEKEKEEKIQYNYEQYLLDLYFEQFESENNQNEYYNPVQVYSRRKVYEACSFGSCCFCEKGCDETSYYITNFIGEEELAPRPDGKCYCGIKRERCPNYIAHGRDCQGFGRVIYN